MSERPRLSRFTRPLALLVALVVVLTLTLYGALTSFSGARTRQLHEEWAESFGTLEEVLERYPPRDSNAAALTVESLAAGLGIHAAPRGLRKPVIAEDVADDWKTIYNDGDLHNYVEEQLERTSGPPDAPPRILRDWLAAYRENLDALVTALRTGEPPRWMLHVEDGNEMQLPNLLGHIQLQKTLTAVALDQLHRGDDAAALATLDAAWELNHALVDDPVLISQLVALLGLKLQVTTLRHVERVPPRWRARLDEARPLQRVIQGLEFEAWHLSQLDGVHYGLPVGRLQRVALRFAAPYFELCAADASIRMRHELARLQTLDYVCDRDLAAVDADLTIELPRWNRLGDVVLPNLLNAVTRAARAEVDIELTTQVVNLRESRRNRSPVASATCPDAAWEVALDPAGNAGIGLNRELGWPEHVGIDIPARFELSLR